MPDPAPSRRRISRGTATVVAVLLAIPCVALALVPLYSHQKPTVLGWPFFYWYQLAWVVITPILTFTAYVLVQRGRGER